MSSYFWGGGGGGAPKGGFSTTSTTRQQRWLVRTVAGSLVAGACGYYGAHSRFLFFFQLCFRCERCVGPFQNREVFLFWSIDDIHNSVRPSRRRLTKPPSLPLWDNNNNNNNNNNKKSRARSKTRRITGSFKKLRRGTRAHFTR